MKNNCALFRAVAPLPNSAATAVQESFHITPFLELHIYRKEGLRLRGAQPWGLTGTGCRDGRDRKEIPYRFSLRKGRRRLRFDLGQRLTVVTDVH